MSAYNWMIEEDLNVKVTGKSMSKLEVKFEVGQYPNIKVDLCIKLFLEALNRIEVIRIKKLCDMRLKCLDK